MRNASSPGESQLLRSVTNALKILAMLGSRPTIRVSDVSAHLGVAKATAHRLLATLEHEKFVEKDRIDRSYRAGRMLVDVGLAAVGDLDVRRKAKEAMRRLAQETGETVNLLLLEGPRTRVVDGVESEQTVKVSSRVGVLLPANVTSGGKVLLATLPPEEVRALFPHGLPGVTAQTMTDWDTFEAELREIRRCGYASNFAESDDSVHGVAVPVYDRRHRPVAALAVATPAHRLPPSRVRTVAEELRRGANSITQTLV